MPCNCRLHKFETSFDRISIMISEGEKYRAQTYNISGFALMSLFGRIAMQPLEIYHEYSLIGFICYTIFCSILFICGLLLIQRGYEEIER